MSFRSGRARLLALSAGVLGISLAPQLASADTIMTGIYELGNHPAGAVNPPPYGLRLDELFDATAGADVFTFDFSDPMSNMVLTYNGSDRIRILGQAVGGRDIGGSYAADQYFGVYTIDFLYDVGVQVVPGDDDIWVAAVGGSNSGTITGPGMLGTVNLSDMDLGGFTFRFGDENSDAGHRGFDGLSGWGWLNFDGHSGSADWIFTGTFDRLPTPGTAGLLAIAGLAATRRRR